MLTAGKVSRRDFSKLLIRFLRIWTFIYMWKLVTNLAKIDLKVLDQILRI